MEISSYKKYGLIPFTCEVNIDVDNKKKLKEINCPPHSKLINFNDYKKYQRPEHNFIAIRTGLKIGNDFIIGIDVDNKATDLKENGIKGWNRLNEGYVIKTATQETRSGGYHFLFLLSEEDFKSISGNKQDLIIDGINYAIDIRAKNGILFTEPSPGYKWIVKPQLKHIQYLPKHILETIRNQTNAKKIIKPKPQTTISNNINTCVDLPQEKDNIRHYFNILSLERIENYSLWFKLGALIYSLNLPFNYWVELSKSSSKFDPSTSHNYMLNMWVKYRKEYTINTLHYWCRYDNLDKHYELEQKYNKKNELNKLIDSDYTNLDTIIDDDIEINKIEFSKRYLLDQTKLLDNNDDIFVNNINEGLNNPNIKTISIKSPYDTGKTQLLKQIVPKYNRILWVSYRISLTNDIKGNFERLGFKSYLNTIQSNKLIIQVESLMKLNNNTFIDNNTSEIPYYDLVIIDEIEGILNQFNSPTMNGNAYNIFNYLENIIKNTPKLIVLDGDISSRTQQFINSFGNVINLYNTIKINQKNIKVIKNKLEYFDDIYNSLNNNKKIVVATQSSKEGKYIQTKLKTLYPQLNIQCFHSKTDDELKMMLEKVVEAFDKLDVLIYTPTIEAGVSYDKIRFYKLYGVMCAGSNSQRAFFQMLSRVRKFETNEVLILNEKLKCNENKLFTFDEVKSNLFNSKIDDNTLFSDIVTTNSENKLIKTRDLTTYGINYVYNLVEENNKHKVLFLSYFKMLAINKGHTIQIDNEKLELTMKDKVLLLEMKNEKKLLDNKDILDAKDIKKGAFEHLQDEKKKNNLSELDKNKLEKHYYKKLLGVDILDDNIINLFCKNSKLANFINLIDIGNYKEEFDDNKFINKQKLDIVLSIIKDFGYKNVFDTTLLNDIEFILKADYIKTHNKMFKNNNLKMLFNKLKVTNKFDTNKAFLGVINSILECYSVKIQSQRKKVNGKEKYHYKLDILDNIDEILFNKINRGFKLIDNDNIFKFDASKGLKYDHLVNIVPANDDEEIVFDSLDMNNTIMQIIHKEQSDLNTDDDDDDDIETVNDNKTSTHQFTIFNKLFKYDMTNNTVTCSHCNNMTEDIYTHCIECLSFKS